MAKKKQPDKEEPVETPDEPETLPPTPAHIDDLRARPHTVHLTPPVRPKRPEIQLTIRDVGTFTFRRGGKDAVLEHVIKLTPPQARQLRARGWAVVEKE